MIWKHLSTESSLISDNSSFAKIKTVCAFVQHYPHRCPMPVCNQRYSLSLGPLLAQKSQSQRRKSIKLTHHQMLFWAFWAQNSHWKALALQTRCLVLDGWCQEECWLWAYCDILPPRKHRMLFIAQTNTFQQWSAHIHPPCQKPFTANQRLRHKAAHQPLHHLTKPPFPSL